MKNTNFTILGVNPTWDFLHRANLILKSDGKKKI